MAMYYFILCPLTRTKDRVKSADAAADDDNAVANDNDENASADDDAVVDNISEGTSKLLQSLGALRAPCSLI